MARVRRTTTLLVLSAVGPIAVFTGTLGAGDTWVEADAADLVDVQGIQVGALFGDRVAGVGDVTSDGVSDFAVSSPFFDGDGFADYLVGARSDLGHAYVMAGVDVTASADVNQDGVVNFDDLLRVLAAWGPCGGCEEDLDGDGAAGDEDLAIVLCSWS